MKKHFLFILLLCFAEMALAQSNFLLSNSLRVNTVVDVRKSVSISQYPIYVEIKNIQAESILEKIMNTALEGKIRLSDPWYNNLYDFIDSTLTIDGLYERLGGKKITMSVFDEKTKTTKDIKIKSDINLKEIENIGFIDEWFFDNTHFSFSKKTLAYFPIRTFFKPDDVENQSALFRKAFILYFDKINANQEKLSNQRLIHYAHVKYEQLMDNSITYTKYFVADEHYTLENDYAPLLSSYTKQQFAKAIIDKALSETTPVHEFNTENVLSKQEIINNLGAGSDTIVIENVETGILEERILKGSIDYASIRSYVFTEDWYLDPLTLRIVKKIRSIAPVRFFYKPEDIDNEYLIKKNVFEIQFKQ
jgi:hypothetical protein